jgi:hypothetical protein
MIVSSVNTPPWEVLNWDQRSVASLAFADGGKDLDFVLEMSVQYYFFFILCTQKISFVLFVVCKRIQVDPTRLRLCWRT